MHAHLRYLFRTGYIALTFVRDTRPMGSTCRYRSAYKTRITANEQPEVSFEQRHQHTKNAKYCWYIYNIRIVFEQITRKVLSLSPKQRELLTQIVSLLQRESRPERSPAKAVLLRMCLCVCPCHQQTHVEGAVCKVEEWAGLVEKGGDDALSHVQGLVSGVLYAVHEDVALLRMAVQVHVQQHL